MADKNEIESVLALFDEEDIKYINQNIVNTSNAENSNKTYKKERNYGSNYDRKGK